MGSSFPGTGAVPSLANLQGESILVAEENELNQIVCEGMLGADGINVDFVSSAGALLDKAKANPYALILVDYNLAPAGGEKAYADIKAALGANTPPAVLTISSPGEAASASLPCVEKPFAMDSLFTAVASHARKPTQAAAPAAPAGRNPVNREEGIKRVAGNQALFDKLLNRIASEVNKNLDDMAASIASGDMQTLSAQAHTLKGSAGNLSITYVYEDSMALEHAAKANDAAHAAECLTTLRATAAEFVSFMQK